MTEAHLENSFFSSVCHKKQITHDASSVCTQQGTTYPSSKWNTFNCAPKINIIQGINGAGSIRITNRVTGPRSDEDQDPVSQKHLSTGIISLHRMQLKWSEQQVLEDWGQCHKEDEEALRSESMMFKRWLRWDLPSLLAPHQLEVSHLGPAGFSYHNVPAAFRIWITGQYKVTAQGVSRSGRS